MSVRAAIVAAVRAELDERAGQCREEHAAIGEAVADRLERAPSEPRPAPPHALDALGTGIFVRRLRDYPVELLARFDWACVAVLSSGREPLNRDPLWWRDASAAGVRLTAMDWLPPPSNWRSGLESAIDWSAEHGSLCYVLDAETPGPPRGWSKQVTEARAYVSAARRMCDDVHTGLGFTGLSILPLTEEWRAFAAGSDLAICQAYDRYGAYEPDYAARSVAQYRRLGASRIAVGRGAFVDPDGVGPERARWRTPGEIAEHRRTTPSGAMTCWWPPAGRPSSRVVDAIVG